MYDESETIDLENVPLNGGFLVKLLVLSIDPYLRGKMRDASKKSYSVRVNADNLPEAVLICLNVLHDSAGIHPRTTVSERVLSAALRFTDNPPRFENFGVGVVLRSENPAIKPGDHLYNAAFRELHNT